MHTQLVIKNIGKSALLYAVLFSFFWILPSPVDVWALNAYTAIIMIATSACALCFSVFLWMSKEDKTTTLKKIIKSKKESKDKTFFSLMQSMNHMRFFNACVSGVIITAAVITKVLFPEHVVMYYALIAWSLCFFLLNQSVEETMVEELQEEIDLAASELNSNPEVTKE